MSQWLVGLPRSALSCVAQAQDSQSFFVLERRLVRWMEDLLGWVSRVLGLALSLVLAW